MARSHGALRTFIEWLELLNHFGTAVRGIYVSVAYYRLRREADIFFVSSAVVHDGEAWRRLRLRGGRRVAPEVKCVVDEARPAVNLLERGYLSDLGAFALRG